MSYKVSFAVRIVTPLPCRVLVGTRVSGQSTICFSFCLFCPCIGPDLVKVWRGLGDTQARLTIDNVFVVSHAHRGGANREQTVTVPGSWSLGCESLP